MIAGAQVEATTSVRLSVTPAIKLTPEATIVAVGFDTLRSGNIWRFWFLECTDPCRWDLGKNMFIDTWGPKLPPLTDEQLATLAALPSWGKYPSVTVSVPPFSDILREQTQEEQSFESGYHISSIKKGVMGEISKIQEELDELKDAMDQGVKIMAMVEVSDLIGAVEAFVSKQFPGVTLEDILAMKTVTQRAFKSGARK